MLTTIRDTAESIARQVGALLLEHAARPDNRVQYKGDIDLVTEADRASETLIIEAIRARFPEHYIHSEEGGGGGDYAAAPYRWYVDPLDGTTNYAHGFPCYAVSLGVTDQAGQPVVGVIYDPALDELFSGITGQGATLNGQPLHVSRTDSLLHALLTSGFPYDAHTAEDNNAAAWSAFLRQTQGLRRMGAAALDMAYAACGRTDGYWENGTMSWDLAAGAVLVQEAGGTVTDYAGQPLVFDDRRIKLNVVASNGLLHEPIQAVLRDVRANLAREGS